jgi:hypothetical protein
VAEHFVLFAQLNFGATHSSHSPPAASQIVLQTVPALQAVPAALHCCSVSWELPVHRNWFAVQMIAGLQAFVLALQPAVPQSTSSMKPVWLELQTCELFMAALHLCSPTMHLQVPLLGSHKAADAQALPLFT